MVKLLMFDHAKVTRCPGLNVTDFLSPETPKPSYLKKVLKRFILKH